jgi:hypothetical protein
MYCKEELAMYWVEAQQLASDTGKVFCAELLGTCKNLCFCERLSAEWEEISLFEKPSVLSRNTSFSNNSEPDSGFRLIEGTASAHNNDIKRAPVIAPCTKTMFKTFVASSSPLKVTFNQQKS